MIEVQWCERHTEGVTRTVLVAPLLAVVASVGIASAKSPFTPIPPIVHRSQDNEVPRAARVLEISWTQVGRRSIVVRNTAAVRHVAQVVNELPEEGKGQCAEGFLEGPPKITFSFRGDRHGPALATATQAARQNDGIGWCIPTTFSALGHPMIRLEGGSYLLKRASAILGRDLNAPGRQ